MKVFLISGKAGHGKSSFGDILEEQLSTNEKHVFRTAFGNPVKDVCKRHFDYKGVKDKTGRTTLQTIGTDVMRKAFPEYWSDIIAKLCKGLYDNLYEYDAFIIDDWRFPSEADSFYSCFNFDDIVTIRVNRVNEDGSAYINTKMDEANRNHESEISLDKYGFNYIVEHSTVEQMRESAEEIIKMTCETQNEH